MHGHFFSEIAANMAASSRVMPHGGVVPAEPAVVVGIVVVPAADAAAGIAEAGVSLRNASPSLKATRPLTAPHSDMAGKS